MKKIIASLILLAGTQCLNAQALHWLSQPEVDAGLIINGEILSPLLSVNGQYVTFSSKASNLVENDSNGISDVFIKKLSTGVVTLVNRVNVNSIVPVNSYKHYSAPTSDGRYVAFTSSSIVFPQADGVSLYLYRKDLQTGSIENLSTYNGSEKFSVPTSSTIHLSDEGQTVYFSTISPIDPLHTGGDYQVYSKNLNTGVFTLISVAADGLSDVDNHVYLLAVSPNGRYVVFKSKADNLVEPLNNSFDNLFIRDTLTGVNSLVTKTPAGAPTFYNGSISGAAVSDNGLLVFGSTHNDLVINDTNGTFDVFLFDGNTNVRISLNPAGQELSSASLGGIISGDGSRVAFRSGSGELVNSDNNGLTDVFAYEVSNGMISLISKNQSGHSSNGLSINSSWSYNGSRLAFYSLATDLTNAVASGIHYGAYIYDYNLDQIKSINQVLNSPQSVISEITKPRVSSDQLSVVYATDATNLVAEPSGDTFYDLFLLDRTNNHHHKVGRKVITTADSFEIYIDISGSGRFVVFVSEHFQPDASIDLGDSHVFLYDRLNDSYVQIAPGRAPKVNNDGTVVFQSYINIAVNDNNNTEDIYIYDANLQTIALLSESTTGSAGNSRSETADIGGNGMDTWVTFRSHASDLIVSDTNNNSDVFLVNWPSGDIRRISQDANGVGGDNYSYVPAISENGAVVVYSTYAQNITTDDYSATETEQVLAFNRFTLENRLVTKNTLGQPLIGGYLGLVVFATVSDSGRYVSYHYLDGEPVDFNYDTDGTYDVMLVDLVNDSTQLISKPIQGNQIPDYSAFPQVVEDLTVTPSLVGVVFKSLGTLTGIDAHPGWTEAFLYQQGGPPLALNISVQGPGVVSGTFAINCSSSCSYNFPLGTSLNLVATAGSGVVFSGWQMTFGDCDDDSNPCSVNMDREKTVIAVFIDPNEVIFENDFE